MNHRIDLLVAIILAFSALWFTQVVWRSRPSWRGITKVIGAALVLMCATVVLPATSEWLIAKQANADKSWNCEYTGTVGNVPPYNTTYLSKSYATAVCNALTKLEKLAHSVDQAAQAVVLPFQTKASGDGSHDTTYPNGDKPPSTVSWNQSTLDTLMAPVASRTTGDGGVSITVTSACSGANCGSATYQLHSSVTGWSLSSAGVLANTGLAAGNSATLGALVLDVCYPSCTTKAASNAYNWSYVSPPGADTNPPNEVTGLNGTAGASSVTLNFDPTTDPDDAVQRKGVATYLIKLNGAQVSTLAASTPGLALDFTGAAVGVTTGSASQSAAPNGGAWSITNNGGTGGGFESGQDTSAYEVLAPVSGSTLCGRLGLASITTAATYGKAPLTARNSATVANAAEATAVVLKQVMGGTSWFLQAMVRSGDGGTMANLGQVTLTGMPHAVAVCPNGSTATIKYSYDGATWINGFTGLNVALNSAKFMGCGAAGTNDGATGVSTTVAVNYCDVVDSTQLSKTVASACTGTCNYTITAQDAQSPTPNESAPAGALSLPVSSGGGGAGAKKFHYGYYMESFMNNTDITNQGNRFALYDQFANDSHFAGWYLPMKYVELEPAQGSYSAGIALVRSEIAHLKSLAQPKRLIIMIIDEPQQAFCGSQACQDAFYPAYLQNCLVTQTFQNTNGVVTNFKWWIPTCVDGWVAMITALGAALDGEPYLEAVQLDYEQALQLAQFPDFNRAAFYNGITRAMQAAAAAFPHTNLVWKSNWGVTGHEADVVQMMAIAKPLGIGWGDQDACSRMPDSPFSTLFGTFPSYIDADNIFAGYGGYDTGHNAGTYTDQRGKMFGLWGVETSELGYASVCNGTGFAGTKPIPNPSDYMSLFDWWDTALHASHAHVYYNNFVGTSVQQWSPGVTNSLWDLVENHPLTHSACPTDYDTLFGNGMPGSGCNTN